MNRRVLLGMSGGVDSSAVAMMLQKEGYEVTGITFIFSDIVERSKVAVNDAQKLAQKLKIKHISANLSEEFNRLVISYFTNEYQKGSTPFPCAKCNPDVKFKNLLKYAENYECDYIATGHYARIDSYNNRKYIFKGRDFEKDQSFFLWGLDKMILEKLLLPLGNINKEETRRYAKSLGYNYLSKKKDSLGICFIEGNNYRKFLELKGIKSEPGNFVNKADEILGQHSGIFNYTIGQRRGLGLNLNEPLFVSHINPDKNEVVLAEYDELYKNRIVVYGLKLIDIQEVSIKKIFTLKIRYRLQNTPCKIELLNESRAVVYLLEPLAMVANGQTAVLYDDDRVVGGGFIESSE